MALILSVLKSSDPMKATFIVCGLAQFLEGIFTSKNVNIEIIDLGYAFHLKIDRDRTAIVDSVRQNGLPLLLAAIVKISAGDRKLIDTGTGLQDAQRKYLPLGYPAEQVVDYDFVRVQSMEHYKKPQNEPVQVDKDILNYPLFNYLCSGFLHGTVMRNIYPLLVHLWYAHSKDSKLAVALTGLILDFFDQYQNNHKTVCTKWLSFIKPLLKYPDLKLFRWRKNQTDLPAISLVSPTTPKGQNLAKASKNKSENTLEIFWLELFFAFVGFMGTAMPFYVRGESKDPDLATFYPLVDKVRWDLLKQTVQIYRRQIAQINRYRFSRKISYEKLASLLVIESYRSQFALLSQYDNDSLIAKPFLGLAATRYKYMTAHIPYGFAEYSFSRSNIERILQAREKTDVVLRKLQMTIANIEDFGLEGPNVFKKFLSYLEYGNVSIAMTFIISFTEYQLHRLSSDTPFSYAPQFLGEYQTMPNYTDYSGIVEDAGLKNIAEAINFCTVRITYRKHSKKIVSGFKIHHGIGYNILRVANSPEAFLSTVSNFIYEYTNESMSVFLATGERRAAISATAYTSLIELVSSYGSDIVAHILIGLAYSSHFKKSSDSNTSGKGKS